MSFLARHITKRWFGVSLSLIVACVAAPFAMCCSPSDDTSVVASPDLTNVGTFRTTNLIVDEVSNLGGVNFPTNINGPTRQTVVVPGGAYAYGELNLKTITGTVPPNPSDLFVDVIRNSAGADCTTATQHSGAMALQVSSVRTAGAFDLTNTALELTAENAQINTALHILKGDFAFDGGGQIYQNSGSAFFAGAYLSTGATTPLIAQNNGTYALYISASPGPTDSIRSLAPDPSWNAKHATASILKLWNEDNLFTLNIAGPALSTLWRPDGIATISDGAFTTGSTTLVGGVTGVGADTTTITFANAFPNRSRCFATIRGTTAQFITATGSTTTCVFRCFAPTTGLAENCQDFDYLIVGQ